MPINPHLFAHILHKHLTQYCEASQSVVEKEYKTKKISKEEFNTRIRAIFASYNSSQLKSSIIKTVKEFLLIHPPSQIKKKEYKTHISEPKRFFIKKPDKMNSIYIEFIGEKHTSEKDHKRVTTILKKLRKEEIESSLLLIERGLTYPSFGRSVREEDISTIEQFGFRDSFGRRMEEEARSWLLAGFIVADLATGKQMQKEKIIILCGDRHADVLEKIEYLINAAAPHLKFRPREMFHHPSLDAPTLLSDKNR